MLTGSCLVPFRGAVGRKGIELRQTWPYDEGFALARGCAMDTFGERRKRAQRMAQGFCDVGGYLERKTSRFQVFEEEHCVLGEPILRGKHGRSQYED